MRNFIAQDMIENTTTMRNMNFKTLNDNFLK